MQFKMTHKFRTLSFIVSLSILAIFSFIGQAHAQLDPTFGTNGVATADFGNEDATLRSFVLPDGKILVVAVSRINGQQKSYFLRYNSDGTPDLTYGANGVTELAIPYFNPNLGEMYDAARQSDGKIVLVGRDRFGNDWRPMVARYNDNATLDTSFDVSRPNISQFDDDRFYSVLIQPDGKILIAGGSDGTSSTYPNLLLMRYNSNGTVDTSFGTNNSGFIVHTGPVIFPNLEGAEFLYLQSTGKIIVGSLREGLTSSPDTSRGKVRRFNSDGTVDNSFTVISFTGGLEFQTVFVLPDDKILVGTTVLKNESLERTQYDAVIKRHNADGSLDTSFGNAGQVSFDVSSLSDDAPKGFQLMPDGQILVAVNVSIFPNRSKYRGNWLALARLSSNGAVNGKFLAAQSGDNERSFITILPDGKILTTVRGAIWRNGGVLLARASGVPLQNYLFHGVPFDFPSSLYASTDPGVYRPSDNRFHFYPSINLNTAPLPGDIIAPSDYLGDFNCELAYFRPSEGNWYIIRDFWGSGTNRMTVRWGLEGDIPVPADYNGDGKSDIAVFRPSNGTWYIYYIADGSYSIYQWGLNGDKPAQGDYDGDGKTDIGVYRPSDGNWYIQRSSDGGYTILHFGLDGDIPVQEDYDGDGKFDIAVFRSTNGVWYRLNSSDGSFFPYQWGLAGDIPVPGDYDSDSKANVAVWRPSNGTWYVVNPDYASMIPYVWGVAGDIPIPGKY
jgi:uncharacterized delta-60 repeat protein